MRITNSIALIVPRTVQIAAAKPTCVNIADVDAAEVEKEKEILRVQALNEGKPEKIVEKIVEVPVEKIVEKVVEVEPPARTELVVPEVIGPTASVPPVKSPGSIFGQLDIRQRSAGEVARLDLRAARQTGACGA